MNKTIILECCRCTSCETQVLSEGASWDEHDCWFCEACFERMQEITAPIKKRVNLRNYIEMQRDKIKQYQSLASRLDVSHMLQREQTILRRLESKLAEISEN